MDKVQAEYFGYPPLRLLGWIMPKTWIRKYLEARYDEQPKLSRKGFKKWAFTHRRNRERMIRRITGK